MHLEPSSIIHNYQKNPPMHIYTNPHNHNIHQISPMQKFTKSHINLKIIEINKSKLTKQGPMPQLCIHLDHIWVQ